MSEPRLPAHHPAAQEVQRRIQDLSRLLQATRNELLTVPEMAWMNPRLRQQADDVAGLLTVRLGNTAKLAHDYARVESARRLRDGDR